MVLSNGVLAGLLRPFLTERWDNEGLIRSRLFELTRQGQRVPHLLFLVGMKDGTVPCWHSEHLWDLVEAVPWAGKAVRAIHRFADGPHTCHAQPDYHRRIRDFLHEALAEPMSEAMAA